MLNLNKPVEWVSSSGKVYPARVICSDFKGGLHSIVVLYTKGDDHSDLKREIVTLCNADGNGTVGGLRNRKVKKTRWTNILSTDDGIVPDSRFYDTKEAAVESVSKWPYLIVVDTVPVTWEDYE